MNSQADMELGRIEEAFKKLRSAYEKYFVGVERQPPSKDRDVFKKALRRLITEPNTNTARRFKIQSLQASYILHESYWDRITRQIEEGTHRRDLFRLERNKMEVPPISEAKADISKIPPVQTPEKSLASQNPATPTAPNHPESLRSLYQAFISARKETGDLRPLSIDTLAQTVNRQTKAIQEKYGCSKVEFAVALKDGKAILKAVPK